MSQAVIKTLKKVKNKILLNKMKQEKFQIKIIKFQNLKRKKNQKRHKYN